MSAEKMAVVHRLLDTIWNKHDLSIIDELVSPGYTDHGPMDNQFQGSAGQRAFAATFISAFPDLSMTIDSQAMDGDLVVTHWTATGTHTGTLMNIAPTNKRATVSGVSRNRVAGGMVAEGWTEWDPNELYRQLGIAAPTA